MTSRERVLAAINHQETDRIPIDLGGFNASTTLAEGYHKLLEHLAIDPPIYIVGTSQFWVLADEVVPAMDEAEIGYISKKAARMREETERFVVTEIFGGWNDLAGPWLGYEKFYMDIIANTSMMHALFE